MATATLARTKTRKANNSISFNRIFDFGNGIIFTAENEEQARTVEWLVSEAKAGRIILPKSDPTTSPPKPDLSDMPKDFNFDAFYAECKDN